MDVITPENVCTRGDALVPAVIVRNRALEVAPDPTAPATASGRVAGSKGAIQVGRAAPKCERGGKGFCAKGGRGEEGERVKERALGVRLSLSRRF